MSAQLKQVIDRFYAFNTPLRNVPKKALLLATCADTETWSMEALLTHFRALSRYLHWDEQPGLLAYGVYYPRDLETTDYPARPVGWGKPAAKRGD